ncbi:hypothetical protein BDR07DRAFT_1497049 [Suillus spraguei]|nr:hypothetical protein BDR07DRAFT_1497049 [Suillus spraguei]
MKLSLVFSALASIVVLATAYPTQGDTDVAKRSNVGKRDSEYTDSYEKRDEEFTSRSHPSWFLLQRTPRKETLASRNVPGVMAHHYVNVDKRNLLLNVEKRDKEYSDYRCPKDEEKHDLEIIGKFDSYKKRDEGKRD